MSVAKEALKIVFIDTGCGEVLAEFIMSSLVSACLAISDFKPYMSCDCIANIIILLMAVLSLWRNT